MFDDFNGFNDFNGFYDLNDFNDQMINVRCEMNYFGRRMVKQEPLLGSDSS